MNLAATPQPTDANLLLAAFASANPAAAPQSDSSSPAFISFIQLLTQPDGGAPISLPADLTNGTDFSESSTSPNSASLVAGAFSTSHASDTIAESIIRAMLGGSSQPATTSSTSSDLDTAISPNTALPRKRKEVDLTAASPFVLAVPAPQTSFDASLNTAIETTARSADASLSSRPTLAASSAPQTDTSNLSNPNSPTSFPISTQPTNPSRNTAMAFGANITAKATSAQNVSTTPVVPSSPASQNDFADADASSRDTRDIPAPKSNSLKTSSIDTSSESTGNTLPTGSQQSGSSADGASSQPVSLPAAASMSPVTITPNMAPHTSAPTTSTAAAVGASAPSPAFASPLTAPPQQMMLRVSPPSGDANTIDIRVAQRAGQMQVTVHTADPALQANLRQDLPDLVQSLDRAGFNAETFVQHSATLAAASGSSLHQDSFSNQGSGGNPPDTRTFGGGSDSGNSKESPFAGQQFSEQHSSGQNTRDRQSQRWLEQIEE